LWRIIDGAALSDLLARSNRLPAAALHLLQALEHVCALLGCTCTYWQRSLHPVRDWFTSRRLLHGGPPSVSTCTSRLSTPPPLRYACTAAQRPSASLILPNNSNSQSSRRRVPIVISEQRRATVRAPYSFGHWEWLAA